MICIGRFKAKQTCTDKRQSNKLNVQEQQFFLFINKCILVCIKVFALQSVNITCNNYYKTINEPNTMKK